MICFGVLISVVLFGNIFSGVSANCKPDTLQKCADIVEFLGNRKSVIGGSELLLEVCRFSENVTICADDAVLRCPNLKDDDYKTLIKVTDKIDKEVCMNGSEIQRTYNKHESCLSTIDENTALKCVQDFIVVLQVLKDSSAKDVCCTFSQAKACLLELLSSNCGDEAANAGVEIANLLASPLVESRCNAFNYTICNPTQASSSVTPAILLLLLFNFLLLIAL